MAVRPGPHLADRGQQPSNLLGQRPGEDDAQPGYHHGNNSGKAQQVPLESLQQSRLLGVILVGAYRADDLIAVQHRRRRPAVEGPTAVGRVVGVVAQQGLDHLGVQAVLPHSAAGLPGIVQNPAGRVGHKDPRQVRLLHHRHGRRHILLRQLIQAGERVYHYGNAVLQRGRLRVKHQVLRHQQRIGVQQQ